MPRYALTFVFLALAACRSPVEGIDSKVPAQCQQDQPLIEPQKLDILFVVDNSGSMQEEQAAVARELTAFIDEVKKGGGVAQDFHVGVITSSVYLNAMVAGTRSFRDYPKQAGALQPVPDLAPDGGVLLGTGTERMLSGEDPNLVEKFSRLVQVGINGSGQETPFEAVRLAISAGHLINVPMDQGGNGGFLRDRARLLVVVVTDEDDCSETSRPPSVTVGSDAGVDYCGQQANALTPISEYQQLFAGLKDSTGATREIVWATIGPVGVSAKQAMSVVIDGQVRNVDCPTSYGPGIRHRQMAEAFDSSLANLDSICKESYRETLIAIAGLANISQVLEVKNVPDPGLLQIEIVRRDDRTVLCTLSNGGLTGYDEPTPEQPGRVHFGGSCKRMVDDKEVRIRMLCAG